MQKPRVVFPVRPVRKLPKIPNRRHIMLMEIALQNIGSHICLTTHLKVMRLRDYFIKEARVRKIREI